MLLIEDQRSMNKRLEDAGILTIETGRKTTYGLPEKALTNGIICILRPRYHNCIAACREHFGVDL